MKTTDLRIGNIVSIHKGFEMRVQALFSDNTVYLDFIPPHVNEGDVWEEKIEDVAGVPLTKEWLLKFGFEKPAHSYICDVFHLSEWDEFKNNWLIAMNKNNAVLIKKLKYVHQLQNIYHALTGEELTIKE